MTDKLLDFFEATGISMSDIHEDEKGAFYFSIEDNGEVANEGYEVESKRVYLPSELQKLV